MRDRGTEDVIWSLEDAGWTRRWDGELGTLVRSPCGRVILTSSNFRWVVSIVDSNWGRGGYHQEDPELLREAIRGAMSWADTYHRVRPS